MTSPWRDGQSYTQSLTFTLPPGIGGTAADSADLLRLRHHRPGWHHEHGIRDNDSQPQLLHDATATRTRPTTRAQQTLPVIYREPDLQVTNLVVPATPPHSGDTIPVSWTVTNVGNRDTREGYWYDRVYLSTSPSLDDQSYMLGRGRPIPPSCRPGIRTTSTLNVQLPDGIQGNFYILVFTDSNVIG